MVRLPLSKLHRAFPELDRFGDADCARYIAAAQRGKMAFMLLGAMTAIAALILTAAIVAVLMRVVSGIPEVRLLGRRSPEGILAFVVMSPIIAGAVSALLVRDRFLRVLIRRQVLSARCMSCEYSLLGLPISRAGVGAGSVRCPECGAVNSLKNRGVSVEELQALARTTGPG